MLYEVTGDREWLKRAEGSRRFISAHFDAASHAGFVTSKTSPDQAYKPHPERDENAQMARFANLLAQYTGDPGDKEAATRAMRYLATPEVALAWLSAPVLLAEMQFTQPPIHLTIVGSKKDPTAETLFRTGSWHRPRVRASGVVGPCGRFAAACGCAVPIFL